MAGFPTDVVTREFMESSGSKESARIQNKEGHEIPTDIHKKTEPTKIPSNKIALLDKPPQSGIIPDKMMHPIAIKSFISS